LEQQERHGGVRVAVGPSGAAGCEATRDA
jgi:hypothetical protein